jgi:hypothetical protein
MVKKCLRCQKNPVRAKGTRFCTSCFEEGEERRAKYMYPDPIWIHKELTYFDPSAAHEKAIKLQSEGAKTIIIKPHKGKYLLSYMIRT